MALTVCGAAGRQQQLMENLKAKQRNVHKLDKLLAGMVDTQNDIS